MKARLQDIGSWIAWGIYFAIFSVLFFCAGVFIVIRSLYRQARGE